MRAASSAPASSASSVTSVVRSGTASTVSAVRDTRASTQPSSQYDGGACGLTNSIRSGRSVPAWETTIAPPVSRTAAISVLACTLGDATIIELTSITPSCITAPAMSA
jgi:hypothetical protein